MIKIILSNLPFFYFLFIIFWYGIFLLFRKNEECLGIRTNDTTTLMEIHSVAMLSGFLLPLLSIFRVMKKKISVIIPYFIELSTSYIIHRIGIYIIRMMNYIMDDIQCSKDDETLNGINQYSYAIVYFFLLFVKLLNSSDSYPAIHTDTISLYLQFPFYSINQFQFFYQSIGPFSCQYSCHCQNYLRYNKKCLYHSLGYLILTTYIISGTFCIGYILSHGYATMNQIFYGVLFAYLMTFLLSFILHCIRPLIKAIILITLLYSFTFLLHSYLLSKSITFSFYHIICVVDFVTILLLTISFHISSSSSNKYQ